MRLVALVVGCAILSFGCTADFAEQSQADVILRISKIIGLEGESEEEGDVLFSDVIPVFNDNARITFQAIPKNPNLPNAGLFNDVFLERYEVRFIRSDGRNTEGVDVPYRFTGGMATLVPVGVNAEAVIVMVRHSAKEEPPLRNLRFLPQLDQGVGGGQGIIHTVAEITFHGRTTSGKAVTTSGRLTVTFADFADETAPAPTTPPPTFASPSPSVSPSPSPRT